MVNTTWITLVPKKTDAKELGDFRPIGMVGCLYKIISKTLSRRLKKVMSFLVGENQTTFIAGRQILNGALIANEIIAWLKKSNKPGVLLKLNFQKAYDMVDWVFFGLCLTTNGVWCILEGLD